MADDDLARDRFLDAPDGLRLHYRDYGPASGTPLPVLCLPGLARTADDFDPLARRLASGAGGRPRRVVALDCRGRGASARDPDPDNYSTGVEAADALAAMDAAGIAEAVFVGTSRGGLITFAVAASRPERIRGVVLNDIGPVLEPAGLARIRGYVGTLPALADWAAAVDVIKGYAGAQFTGLSDDDWLAFARTTFAESGGVLAARYDPAIARSLRDLDLDDLPTLWPAFATIRSVPLLVIRGEHSDLLSEATASEMIRRHPDGALLTVPGQGHAPLLRDAGTLDRIARFARHCDELPAPRHASGIALDGTEP